MVAGTAAQRAAGSGQRSRKGDAEHGGSLSNNGTEFRLGAGASWWCRCWSSCWSDTANGSFAGRESRVARSAAGGATVSASGCVRRDRPASYTAPSWGPSADSTQPATPLRKAQVSKYYLRRSSCLPPPLPPPSPSALRALLWPSLRQPPRGLSDGRQHRNTCNWRPTWCSSARRRRRSRPTC